MAERNNWPKLHNAMWPGVVGKGGDAEPPIGLTTLLDLTAAASVDGVKFDGVDLFLADPHTGIDFERRRDQPPRRYDRIQEFGDRLAGGAGLAAGRRRFGDGKRRGAQALSSRMVEKACRIGKSCAISACGHTASFASIRRPASMNMRRIRPPTRN